MKTYNLNFLIDENENITFQSIYAHIEEREQGLFCSLEGEFLQNNAPFEPSMRYEMRNIGVTTRDINVILRDKYHFLVMRDYPDLAKGLLRKK